MAQITLGIGNMEPSKLLGGERAEQAMQGKNTVREQMGI